MKRPTRFMLLGAAVASGLVLAGLLVLQQQERNFAKAVEAIEVGSSRQAVFDRLGAPTSEGTDCYVAQFVKFEKPAQRPTAANCAHWLGSSPGFQFYAVGFGSDNNVVWVAYGDS